MGSWKFSLIKEENEQAPRESGTHKDVNDCVQDDHCLTGS